MTVRHVGQNGGGATGNRRAVQEDVVGNVVASVSAGAGALPIFDGLHGAGLGEVVPIRADRAIDGVQDDAGVTGIAAALRAAGGCAHRDVAAIASASYAWARNCAI